MNAADIVERLGIRDELRLDRLVDMLASAVGSLTNPARLSRAMGTAFREAPDPHTVKSERIGDRPCATEEEVLQSQEADK